MELVLEHPHPQDPLGVQKIYRAENGYGASVVSFRGIVSSYGYSEGLWELAVIEFYGDDALDFHIAYDTPITSDVLGYLTAEEVSDLLERIASLPPSTEEQEEVT